MKTTINTIVSELQQLSISSYHIGLISESLQNDYLKIIKDIYNKKVADSEKVKCYETLYYKIKDNYKK